MYYLTCEFMHICIYLIVTIMWIFKKDLSYDIQEKKEKLYC